MAKKKRVEKIADDINRRIFGITGIGVIELARIDILGTLRQHIPDPCPGGCCVHPVTVYHRRKRSSDRSTMRTRSKYLKFNTAEQCCREGHDTPQQADECQAAKRLQRTKDDQRRRNTPATTSTVTADKR